MPDSPIPTERAEAVQPISDEALWLCRHNLPNQLDSPILVTEGELAHLGVRLIKRLDRVEAENDRLRRDVGTPRRLYDPARVLREPGARDNPQLMIEKLRTLVVLANRRSRRFKNIYRKQSGQLIELGKEYGALKAENEHLRTQIGAYDDFTVFALSEEEE